jgi:hypothetical protein
MAKLILLLLLLLSFSFKLIKIWLVPTRPQIKIFSSFPPPNTIIILPFISRWYCHVCQLAIVAIITVCLVQPPHSTEVMAGTTAHLLILTPHSSSFPRPTPLFLPSSRPRHPHSAIKSLTLRHRPTPFRPCAQSHQGDGSGSGSKESKGLSWVEPILSFARGNVLPLGASLYQCFSNFVFY